MKKMRKDLEDETSGLNISNGLVMRQVPHIKKLYFEPETSDFLVYQRKTKLDLETDFMQSYKTSLRFKQVLEARRLKLEENAKNSPSLLPADEAASEVQINVSLPAKASETA